MANRMEIFVVRELKPTAEYPDPKSFWTKVGAAFENRDGSYSLVLDAIPASIDGQYRLQMREPLPPRAEDNGPAEKPAEKPNNRPAARTRR